MEYRDLAGQEIKEGSYIVYAALWSRSPVLKFGKVVSLSSRDPSYYQKESTPTIKAITVDRFWGNKGKFELQKEGKPVTLGFLDRLLVVNDLPQGVKDLIEGVTID